MHRVQSRRLSDDIMEQLEAMIFDGRLLAGQKLLSERALAEQFEVSRPSVREAIQKLEAKGLVDRKQGGGTYVKPRLNELITDPLLQMLYDKPELQFDLLEFRHALEGMAAYYAALRGQPEDFLALKNALNALPIDSEDKNVEAKALVNFYYSPKTLKAPFVKKVSESENCEAFLTSVNPSTEFPSCISSDSKVYSVSLVAVLRST